MVKTIFLDSLLMPVVGMLLGISIRRPEKSQTGKPWFLDSWFYYRFVFGSLFGYGTAVVCYLIAPDWMWMYILDSRHVSWPLMVYVSVMYHVLLFAGLLIAETMLAYRRLVWGGIWLLLAGTTLICVVWFSRLWFVGTVSEFYRGLAVPLIQKSPFHVHAIGIIMIIVIFLGICVFTGMYRTSKQAFGR